MQKRIYLIAFIIAGILCVQNVQAQSGEQKFRAQIQKKKQEVANMQRNLEIQRQQRLGERIPPPPITHNTTAKTAVTPAEPPANGSGNHQSNGGSAADQTKSTDTRKEAGKHEDQ